MCIQRKETNGPIQYRMTYLARFFFPKSQITAIIAFTLRTLKTSKNSIGLAARCLLLIVLFVGSPGYNKERLKRGPFPFKGTNTSFKLSLLSDLNFN